MPIFRALSHFNPWNAFYHGQPVNPPRQVRQAAPAQPPATPDQAARPESLWQALCSERVQRRFTYAAVGVAVGCGCAAFGLLFTPSVPILVLACVGVAVGLVGGAVALQIRHSPLWGTATKAAGWVSEASGLFQLGAETVAKGVQDSYDKAKKGVNKTSEAGQALLPTTPLGQTNGALLAVSVAAELAPRIPAIYQNGSRLAPALVGAAFGAGRDTAAFVIEHWLGTLMLFGVSLIVIGYHAKAAAAKRGVNPRI